MKARIEIRRHGPWDYEKDRLTPEGEEEVKKLAEEICEPGKIICASSYRAFQTAKILSREEVEVEISPSLNEIPEIDQEKEFNPETAVRCAREAHKFIHNKFLESHNKFLESTESLLIITSGGLLGALELYLKDKDKTLKTLKTEDELPEFRPLEGIEFFIQIGIIGLKRVGLKL